MTADDSIAAYAQGQHGLITRPQALSRGLSSPAIGRRLSTGQFQRIHQGVYRLRGTPSSFGQQVMAATLAIRGSAASHGTAATLLGLPHGHQRVEVSVARGHTLLPDVRIHRAATLGRIDVGIVGGIRTTSVSRTVIDLAGVLDASALAGLTDHVLAKRLVKLPYLLGRLEALGTRGHERAGELRELLRARQGCSRFVDSEAQRSLARLIDRYGLPRPQVEYAIRLPNGKWKFVDAAWPCHRLILEVQGYEYHSGLDAWTADQARNNQFVALGWRVLFVTPTQIETDPAGVAAMIAEALRLEAAAG